MNNLPLLLGGGIAYFLLTKSSAASIKKSGKSEEVKVESDKVPVSKPKPIPKKKNPDPIPSEIPPQTENPKEDPLDDLNEASMTLWDTDEPGLFQIIYENSLPVFNIKVYSDQPKNAPLPLVLFVGPMNGVFTDPKTGLWVNRGEDEMIKDLIFPEAARYAFIRPLKYEKGKNLYTELNEVIFKDELNLYKNQTFNESVILGNKFLNLASAEMMIAISKLTKYFPTTKTYIVGYSTGSAIIYKLMEYMKSNYPNPKFPISGIMTIGGLSFPNIYGGGYGEQPASKNIPVISVHGINDPYVPISKGKYAYIKHDGPKLGFIPVPLADHSLTQLKSAINQSLKALMKHT